jgi:NitT/TauT family transport system permease protein
MERLRMAARAAFLPIVLLAAWEALARAGRLPIALTSEPSAIGSAFATSVADGSLAQATVQTLVPATAGWLVGNLLGVAAGVALATVPRLRDAVGPAIDLFRSVPPVALIPVALLAFGLGPKLEIVMVAFTIFWPVTILTASAVRSVDARLIEVGRALRFHALQRVTHFVLPAAAPSILVALRLAAGIALVIAVTTEIIANPSGLGYGITLASTTLRPDMMFADLLWLAVLGFAINACFDVVERRAFGWVR